MTRTLFGASIVPAGIASCSSDPVSPGPPDGEGADTAQSDALLPVPDVIAALAYMDVPEGATCLEWKSIDSPDPAKGSGPCNCWEPPYCWCAFPGEMLTKACAPAGSPCCWFMTTCVPCGWKVREDAVYEEGAGDPAECGPVIDDMGDWTRHEWKGCAKWSS